MEMVVFGEIPPPRCHGRAALLKSCNEDMPEFVLRPQYFPGRAGAQPIMLGCWEDYSNSNYLLSVSKSKVLISQ